MKKYLIAFLLSLTCAFTLAGVACSQKGNSGSGTGNSSDSTEEVITDPCVVAFENGEGYSFVCDKIGKDGTATVQKGKTISFTVDLGAFYTGNPQVFLGDKSVSANANGVYTAIIDSEDAVISIKGGVNKDISQMAGTGAIDNPFQVSKPIDLLYIAEQVNKKNYTYMTGSYLLVNDIDCKGEKLEVIGNDPDNDAYFSGCFSVNYNEETNEIYDYSISNFVIETTDTNYVGLFGSVFKDLSVESSGLFYGIQLENFAINASMYKSSRDSKTISCGGLIGYGVGTTMILCGATDGEINVLADKDYFAFAGGLIGYQQGYYFSEYGESAPSEIAYAKADVEINVLDGLCLNAGGIVGYMSTNYPFGAVASVHNSYAYGSVYGALRAGGIAGGIGQYSVVSNSYATGEVVAEAIKNNSDPLWKDSEYCIAHAGGLVGFAENDSIVHDSAYFGKVSAYAKSGKAFANANDIVGGGHEENQVSVQSEKYIVLDCATGSDIDLSDATSFTKKLGWGDHDWVFTANEYPTINYEASAKAFSLEMKLQYVDTTTESLKVQGNTSESKVYFNSASENPSYSSIGDFFATGSLELYLEADNGYLSYGYFFDKECTQRVPYAYFPMKHIELYVGFADPTPVVGTYYFTANATDEVLEITFDKGGVVTYSEGATKNTSYYSFDGKTLTLDSARLTMYFDGEIVVDPLDTSSFADEQFDLYRYMWYSFKGELTESGISLYDGVYFTKENPFTATKESPEVETFDAFKGAWSVSATVNKTFTFDGLGNWSYKHIAYTRTFDYMNGYVSVPTVISQESGAYTRIDSYTIALNDQNGYLLYTARLTEKGALEIQSSGTVRTYYREIGYTGAWSGSGFVLDLLGLQASGIGYATVAYDDGTYYELVYAPSNTDGYLCLYIDEGNGKKGDLYGYFNYDVVTNTLTLVSGSADSETGYAMQSLFVIDDYNGEWISNATEFLGAEFDFNGFGLYGFTGMRGEIRITKDGKTERIEYVLDSTQAGNFSYNGTRYQMTYDEVSKSITLTATDKDAMELERKDIFAGIVFVDTNGKEYVFDGMSNLSIGGKIFVDGTQTYKYIYEENTYKVYQNEVEVGAVARENGYYALRVNGQKHKLYQKNDLMGSWAISGAFALFEIGPTDLDGKIMATYRGHSVSLSYLTPSMLTFKYRDTSGFPYTYYIFLEYDSVTEENVIILSEYANLLGEYIVCSKADELFGEWNGNGYLDIKFDGVRSGYKQGTAILSSTLGGMSNETEYNYTIKDNGILMWSKDRLGGRTIYYRIDFTENTTDRNAFVKDGKAILRTEVDGLCLTLAKDTKTREIYEFDGGCINSGIGGIWVGDTKKYEYSYITYNSDSTATLTVKEVATGKSYYATLDYNDQANITFTLGAEIVG